MSDQSAVSLVNRTSNYYQVELGLVQCRQSAVTNGVISGYKGIFSNTRSKGGWVCWQVHGLLKRMGGICLHVHVRSAVVFVHAHRVVPFRLQCNSPSFRLRIRVGIRIKVRVRVSEA